MERPRPRLWVVLPLGEPGVRRPYARRRARRRTEERAQGRDDHTGMAHGDDDFVRVLPCEPHEHALDALVERGPALTAGREHALRLRLHVERSVATRILRPREPIALARMQLAQIALL